jgi:(S)-citramalyl-CoA lyase
MTTDPFGTTTSWLFVPGSRPDRFDKALASGARGVILDLEDSVTAGDKQAAREAVSSFLERMGGDAGGSGRAAGPVALGVRVNASGHLGHVADLEMLGRAHAGVAVFVPKLESAAALEASRIHLGPRSDAPIVAMVESARGVLEIGAMLDSPARPGAVMIGAGDLAADLGAVEGAGVVTAASAQVLLHAAARGIPAIASPTFEFRDLAVVEAEARHAVADGYAAKAAIHPAQLAAIYAAFRPSADELDRARRIVEVAEGGIGDVDGTMVDEAVARQARRVLGRAR